MRCQSWKARFRSQSPPTKKIHLLQIVRKKSNGKNAEEMRAQPFISYEQRFDLIFVKANGGKVNLGSLRVYSSSDIVLSRGMTTLYAILISAIIKTIAIWLVICFVVRKYVAEPIVKLASELNAINRELPNVGLAFNEHQSLQYQDDELRFLLRSFVFMKKALQHSNQKLVLHQQELEQKIQERTNELQHQAMHDELTGLFNRRAFENLVVSLIDAGSGVQVSHILCFLDLDHFKQVNDTFGHAMGDGLLQKIAIILTKNFRPTDIIARRGGDEFAVIILNCPVMEAQKKLERLRCEIAGIVIEENGKQVGISLSAGLVSFSNQSGIDINELLIRADNACYAAKAAGRNAVRFFEE
jgi:diguanylate cyclase (GGDEF)-like protein